MNIGFQESNYFNPSFIVAILSMHVGMYLGNGRIVHAPQPGGVIMVSGLDRWSSIYAIGYPIVDDGHTPNDEGQQGEEDGEM